MFSVLTQMESIWKWMWMAPFLFLKCSKTCGRGVRRREVLCKNSAAETLPESLCSGSPRPETQEGCVLGRCPKNTRLQWITSSWSEVWVRAHNWEVIFMNAPSPTHSHTHMVPFCTCMCQVPTYFYFFTLFPWLQSEERETLVLHLLSLWIQSRTPTSMLVAPIFRVDLPISLKPLRKFQGCGF